MPSLLMAPNNVSGLTSGGSNAGNNPYAYPHGGAAPGDRSTKGMSLSAVIKPMSRTLKGDSSLSNPKQDPHGLQFDKEDGGVSTRR